jgi:hypothetical protein
LIPEGKGSQIAASSIIRRDKPVGISGKQQVIK